MPKRTSKIMSLAAAIAALAGTTATVSEAQATSPRESAAPDAAQSSDLIPNLTLSVGQDLLGFIVTKSGDETVLAQHVSHMSHSSHASHASHHSSRY
jgi:hypothetical protein